MKRSTLFSVLLLLTLALNLLSMQALAQGVGQKAAVPASDEPPCPASSQPPPAGPTMAPEQEAWQYGPPSTFQYQRFDGVFVPGPAGEPWANKVYFPGGRISAPAELPDIWVFDPRTGLYTDTQANVVEDVSNYNANLIMDDGSGRGPAIYVVGGTNKDGGGVNIGLVQVYYPALNLATALPAADYWPGMVAGNRVGGLGTAVVDDVIYAFGGWETNAAPYFYTGTWVLDPRQISGSRWTPLDVFLDPGVAYIQTAVQDGKIYAMGGIWQYPGESDLVPTNTVQVLDTANVAAGWTRVAPLPIPTAEGRGFGFDADTRRAESVAGHIYLAGGGDWPDISREAMDYSVVSDTWDLSFPDLNDRRVNHAGVYVPLYSADPHDGLPGMWVFGGRSENGCDPPYGATEYYALPVPPNSCNILLVDDDWDQYDGEPWNGTGSTYYTSTLDAIGLNYDRWDVWAQGDPSLTDMQGYDVVIWFTGYAWQETITSSNQADLAAYLDGGGNLLVSSEDLLYDQGISYFARRYLGIAEGVQDTNETDLVGNAGHPIGGGLGPYTLTAPTSWPSGTADLYTDQIVAAAGAGSPFRFQASGMDNSASMDAGIWRTAFFAWPIEGLSEGDDRLAVLSRALDWFCYSERPAAVLLIPPSQTGSAVRGTAAPYTLTLINNVGVTDTFALDYSAAWPIAGPASIGPVADGTAVAFAVTVTVPADANCGDMDTAIVTATSMTMPADYWDNAQINTSSDPPAGAGDLAGTVHDANTGLGIPDAHVYLALGPFYTETTANGTGAYTFSDLDACNYTVGADAPRYVSTALSVTIDPDMTTTQDLTLAASRPDLSDDAVSIALPANTTGTYALTLTNSGTADLLFDVAEMPTDTLWLSMVPISGVVAPSASLGLLLTLGASGLLPDTCYSSTLAFAFNDPYTREASMPVEMCVLGEPNIVPPPPIPAALLSPGMQAYNSFTVANSGTADLEWILVESPSVPWLEVSPVDGTLAPSGSVDINITYTAPLTPSIYTTDLLIQSNDPDQPMVTVTVVMEVVLPCTPVESAGFSWSPLTPTVGSVVTFEASYAPPTATTPIAYTWDFGEDGGPVLTNSPSITHTFSITGTLTVVLTVTNPCDAAPVVVTHMLTINPQLTEFEIYLPIVVRGF